MRRLATFKFALCVALALAVLPATSPGKDKQDLSPIDIYIREASTSDSAYALTAGSLYTKAGVLSDLSIITLNFFLR